MGCVVTARARRPTRHRRGVRQGAGIVFRHGKTVRKVEESAIVDALMEEIKEL